MELQLWRRKGEREGDGGGCLHVEVPIPCVV